MSTGLLPHDVRACAERFLRNLERYDEFTPGLGEDDSLPEVLLEAICDDGQKLEDWWWHPGPADGRCELIRQTIRTALDAIARACDPASPTRAGFPPFVPNRPPAGFSAQGRKLLADALEQDSTVRATPHPPTSVSSATPAPGAAGVGTPPAASPPGDGTAAPPVRSQYTLGWVIQWLDGGERNREVRLLNHQEQYRRNPINAVMNRTYESALSVRLEDMPIPGIRRIELLCDLEDGEPGITAAKVRRLRARICRKQDWQPQHANELTLDEAADILEGVRRVTLDDQRRAGEDAFFHGLATIDRITAGPCGEVVEVTGLSCKVIAGATPALCPDANPVLPPSLLPAAERALRRLNALPAGTTIHWVGHDTGIRGRCRCHPNAPFAAPYDQARWAGVAQPEPPSEARANHDPQPQPATDNDSDPFTVTDIRDLLVYQAKLAAHQAGLKDVNPCDVLTASWFPSASPKRTAEVVATLTPPTPPRLTENTAWSLPTYRRLVETARAAQRQRPDENDLMLLVGEVAGRTKQSIELLLQLHEREFARVLPPAEPLGQECEASGSRVTRLMFDDATRKIALDGVTDDEPLAPEAYQFLKALGSGDRCGRMVPGRDITGPGLAGKKVIRIIEKLPRRWKKLITSQRGSGGGYCLTLPPKSCP